MSAGDFDLADPRCARYEEKEIGKYVYRNFSYYL